MKHHTQHTQHKGSKTTQGEQNNTRGSKTVQGEQNSMKARQPKTGDITHTTPRHSTRSPSERKRGRQHSREGDANARREGHHHHAPPFNTMPPTTTTRPHHPRWPHPPSTTRGERTEDTPPHEQHRHTPTTHTPRHQAKNSARHDSSTRQHCSGMSRARATPLHWAGQQQHTPPPFHTPRRMDTIHSSTHLLLLIHVHTTDDRR